MHVNEDLSYVFALSPQWLWALGVWPDLHASLSDFRRPKLRFMFVLCILSFYVFIPQIINVLHSWGNVALIVQHVASANFSLMALCKLIVTQYHGKTLQTLMVSIMSDWVASRKNWERNTMLKIAQRGRNLSFKSYAFSTCTFMFYLFFNLRKYYQNYHQTQRSLVYAFNFFYNTQKSPNYEITYFVQLSGGMLTCFINATVDSFVSMILLHVCAQLINLQTTLSNLVNESANRSISSSKFREGLAMIVMRHEYLTRNVKTVNNCYSAVLFVHMLGATFQLCFETFQFFTIITNKNSDISILKTAFLLFYLMFVLVQLYFYCYSAERLQMESTNIAYSVYTCKWYDLPPADAKDLMIIVHRSNIPLKLTAGKFGIFSIEMFGNTIKTSIGYVSALLNMMG